MTTTNLKQTNASKNQKIVPETDSINIANQFQKLKELFLLKDTAKTFTKSLQLLFIVFKESMILIWLSLCWCIVALSLLGDGVIQTTKRINNWWSSLSSPDTSKKEVAITTFKGAIHSLISKAKKQVGLQVD